MAFATTQMDLEIIMLHVVSQRVRHQCHILSLTCGILKKDTMNFFAEQILTQTEKLNGFQMRQGWGWQRDGLGIWDGNAIKLGCDDHCTTINVTEFIWSVKKCSVAESSANYSVLFLIYFTLLNEFITFIVVQ